jgi:Tfp pilus assembly protein PilZ
MEKTGWVEKRQYERVMATLKASYERLSGSKAAELLAHPDYLATSGGQNFLGATTSDVSKGGLSLLGQEAFSVGEKLLVKLEIPLFKGAVTCLAEVVWTDQFEEMHRRVYRAGLKFLSMHKDDVLRVDEYLKGRAKA